MKTSKGFGQVIDPDSAKVELDTRGSGPCYAQIRGNTGAARKTDVFRDPRTGQLHEVMGAACRVCMRAVCLPCEVVGTCTPFERRLERLEARDRSRRHA